MAPPHSKRLGLKYVIVHFRNDLTQSQVIHNQVDNTSTYTYLQSTIVGTQLLQGLGGNCMGNNHYRRKEEESKRMYYLGEEKKSEQPNICVYLVQRTMYGAAWLVQQWSVQQWSVQ